MKKASIVLSSVLMFLMLSSFGIAENNKYVRAKTHQVEIMKNSNDMVSVHDLPTMKVVTVEDDLEGKKKSIASTLGAFLLDSIKTFVQHLFSLLKN